MSDADVATSDAMPVVLPRPRLRAIGITAAVLWLPCLLPLSGIVNDSSHSLTAYLMCFVAVPGMLVSAILQLDDFWFGAVAVVVTMMIFMALYCVARYWPRPFMQVVMAIAAGLIAFAAIGLGHAFRA